MPRGSSYITLEERERIHALLDQGYSPRQIAHDLGHAPATIVRELRRSRYLATMASQSSVPVTDRQAQDEQETADAVDVPGRELSRAHRRASRRTRAAWKAFEARQSGLARPGGARAHGTQAPAGENEASEAERTQARRRRAGAPSDQVLAAQLRVPGLRDHKYTRGVVGVYAGSRTYPGAAVLVTSAAVRAGAGLVRILAPTRVEDLVLSARPEVVPADGRCQALVIGPGTDPSDSQRADDLKAAIRRAVTEDIPAVIDAGALPLVAQMLAGRAGSGHGADAAPDLALSARRVLTPHAGEAAQMLTALGVKCGRAEVEAGPVAAVTELAQLTGATVVLKGSPTLVAGPVRVPAPAGGGRATGGDAAAGGERRPGASGTSAVTADAAEDDRGDLPGAAALVDDADRVRVWALDSGPGWLATAGSGDVLAGVMGAVLAAVQADTERGAADPGGAEADGQTVVLDPVACAALAVRLHALAGWEAAWRAGRSARPEESGTGIQVLAARGAGSTGPSDGSDLADGAGLTGRDRADRGSDALVEPATDLGQHHEAERQADRVWAGGPFAALDLAEALPAVVARMLAGSR